MVGSSLCASPTAFWRADDAHAVLLQLGQLLLGRPAPQADVEIDARRLVLRRVARALQPDGDGEEVGIAQDIRVRRHCIA